MKKTSKPAYLLGILVFCCLFPDFLYPPLLDTGGLQAVVAYATPARQRHFQTAYASHADLNACLYIRLNRIKYL